MATIISTKTSSVGGLSVTGDASGILQLASADGTTALTINASQNVGIGTSSPAQKLTVSATTATQGIVSTTTGNAAYLVLQNSADSSNAYVYATGKELRLSQADTSASSIVTISTQNTERMRIDSSGNLLVGTTSADAIFQVKGAGSTSATRAIRSINSSSTELFAILNDGSFYTGAAAASPYNATTAIAANVYVNSGGQLFRSTSSSRYKNSIQDATYGLKDVLKLRPVTYKGNNDGEKTFGGLIAEEVDAVGLKEFVQYNEQNQPDALHYANMVSLAFKAIQELKAIIDTQNARIEALEAK